MLTASAQAHELLIRRLGAFMDDYYDRPGKCDEMLLDGPSELHQELYAYIATEATQPDTDTVLVTPRTEIVAPMPALLEASNHSGLCGLTHGMPLQGRGDKVPSVWLLVCPCLALPLAHHHRLGSPTRHSLTTLACSSISLWVGCCSE